ncbi:hypothetical protein QPK87_33380, partial [Kamptonema cortianum]|nr:hypothetical protein [Kamptonema cortianum]
SLLRLLSCSNRKNMSSLTTALFDGAFVSSYPLYDETKSGPISGGLTGLEKVSDQTTHCQFRKLLISQNIWEYLLALANYQIEQKGALVVKYSRKG